MQKMTFAGIEEALYYEKLDNGLEVYMVPKTNKNNCFVTYTTRYGSIHTEFIPIEQKNIKHFPYGIAHFLEHKMFEQETGIDSFTFFAKHGADANAATGFFYTTYLFISSTNILENLKYLLNYVNAPYFTDENVEKEKGIIEQEIKMYEDDPMWVLQDGLRANVFAIHPISKSVGGTIESIRSITKEDLYDCYNTFYHPTNMILIITGNFDPTEVIEVIKTNQKDNEKPDKATTKLKKYDEPLKVVKEYEEREMLVEVSKVSVGIKIPLKKLTKYDPKVRNLYLGIIGYNLFGKTSLFYERMKEEGLLTSILHLSKVEVDDYLLATITAESHKPKELADEIKKQLGNIVINEVDFERLRKILISNNISVFDNIEVINNKILDNLINYRKIYFDELDIIKKLNFEELKEFIKKLNLENTSTFIIKPKENS